MSTNGVIERRILTPAEYEAWAAPPPLVPTQVELFESQIALWTTSGFATETELRPLGQFVPESGVFSIIPEFSETSDLAHMMATVTRNGTSGINYVNVPVVNDITVPRGPYILLGISDGRNNLDIAPVIARESIQRAGGSPFIGVEVIAFAACFPAVLNHHALWAAGSRCKQDTSPYLCVRGNRPTFDYVSGYYHQPGWGSPWCRGRVGLRL